MSDNWLTDVIARETAYDEGYEAGKQATAEQIFAELEHASKYWKGYVSSDVGKTIAELKKKYGVK